MESQPQNPEFRNNPENFHPCRSDQTYLEKRYIRFVIFSATSTRITG